MQLTHKNLIMNYLKTIIKVLITLVFFYSVLYAVSEFVGPDFKKGEYLMEYKVYYQNNPTTYTIKNDWPIEVGSRRGANYIVKIKQIYNFIFIPYFLIFVRRTSEKSIIFTISCFFHIQ